MPWRRSRLPVNQMMGRAMAVMSMRPSSELVWVQLCSMCAMGNNCTVEAEVTARNSPDVCIYADVTKGIGKLRNVWGVGVHLFLLDTDTWSHESLPQLREKWSRPGSSIVRMDCSFTSTLIQSCAFHAQQILPSYIDRSFCSIFKVSKSHSSEQIIPWIVQSYQTRSHGRLDLTTEYTRTLTS